MIPNKQRFVRERRRLKKLVNLRLPKGEILRQFGSWIGDLHKYNCHRSLYYTRKVVTNLLYNYT